MDFFESQDTAKRNTGRLIFLFVLAVFSLIVVTNLLVMLIFGFLGTEMTSMAATQSFQFDWEIFFAVGAVVSGVVLIGSLYKIGSLSGGGARVAEMMNGRLLIAGTDNFKAQRTLNVVEEMAIASGTPVPPVYIMEEEGINAFAAGYSPSDAVIGITRGAIENLNRDELQGVIAHEFSHILHGDMRINIRLIGVLHGIMVLGLIGYHLLRSSSYSRRSKESGGIVALGLGLIIVGWVGTFFGNLIKAAVSRQREYLADASAVQFTRNPDGIAGALMRIAQHAERSFLDHPNSSEISHALFEEAKFSPLSGLYATHPPLEERISAILPNWDGSYELIAQVEDAVPVQEQTRDAEQSRPAKLTAVLTGTAGVIVADSVISDVGSPTRDHIAVAENLRNSLPKELLDAAHDPSGARAIIYLLVLSDSDPTRRRQLNLLENNADEGVYKEVELILKNNKQIDAVLRIPLVEIALSSLRQLSQRQYQLFKNNFNELIALDKKINLLEWALQKNVFNHLDSVFTKNKKPKMGRKELKNCETSASILLTIIAHSNKHNKLTVQKVFAKGTEQLPMKPALASVDELTFEKLNSALIELVQVKPLQKPALLKACAASITADNKIAPIEAELLRAIAATLDCPMPPLLQCQS
ncbi:MAG: M48 family metallopeptidase [Gammaproteobacteria bacterium]|nr:M48 family metallopeptidase [Gammaproteobacteria bacterium]